MPEPRGREFTHGEYDQDASAKLLADKGFVQALSTCLTLLGTCLLASPTTAEFRAALDVTRVTARSGDWPFGDGPTIAHAGELIASHETTDELRADYQRLFRGPGHLEAAPWGSVYMDHDQVLYGWTWVSLREWMRESGVRGTYAENDPEDNFGRLLCMAAEVANARPERLCELLADHLLCWSPRFLEVLAGAARTDVYRGLATLSAATLDDIRDVLGITPATRRLYR